MLKVVSFLVVATPPVHKQLFPPESCVILVMLVKGEGRNGPSWCREHQRWIHIYLLLLSLLSPAESSDLDVVLDDTIVEAAWKRRVYPKRILTHVVHTLKAERKLLVGLSGDALQETLFGARFASIVFPDAVVQLQLFL